MSCSWLSAFSSRQELELAIKARSSRGKGRAIVRRNRVTAHVPRQKLHMRINHHAVSLQRSSGKQIKDKLTTHQPVKYSATPREPESLPELQSGTSPRASGNRKSASGSATSSLSRSDLIPWSSGFSELMPRLSRLCIARRVSAFSSRNYARASFLCHVDACHLTASPLKPHSPQSLICRVRTPTTFFRCCAD